MEDFIKVMNSQKSNKLMGQVLALINEYTDSNIKDQNSSDATFASLLENFVHFDFSESSAEKHWEHILYRYEELQKKLGDDANAHLAIVDYFTNYSKQILNQPMLVEVHVFKQAEEAAMIDGLTGIFNRRYMELFLKKEYNRCKRYNKKLAICIIDIDNFKNINDTYGHQFGDLVLKTLAKALKNVLREEDIACRYGGEEFLIILPETDTEGSYVLTERIRDSIKNISPFKEKSITFSAGVASFPACAGDTQTLIRCADRALYEAKFTGKNKTIKSVEERRKFDRFAQTWKLDMFQSNPRNIIKGLVTKDVSYGGIQFECEVNYPVDTELYLHFTSPENNNQIIEAKGRITWATRINDNLFNYGLAFLNLPDVLQKAFTTKS